MAKNRKKKGVNRRVAEREIAAEPGMYGASQDTRTEGDVVADFLEWAKEEYGNDNITAEDLKSYREVAAAFPPELRNPKNSWEVHEKLKDHPNRFDLIQKPWTEDSLSRHLDTEFSYVVGARDDKSIFDSPVAPTSVRTIMPNNPFGVTDLGGPMPERHRAASQNQIDDYMTEYSKRGYDGDDLVLVHGGPGESPMLFPRPVLAKAQAHGENLVPFTEAETIAWRASKGDKASVRFVLDYNDEDSTTTSTSKNDLDAAWYRAQDEVAAVEKRLGFANEQVSHAATGLLAATEGMSSGWTLDEVTSHLKTPQDRTAEIIQGMVDRGHVETTIREDGERVYRMTEDGRQYQMRALALKKEQGEFDENDPRFQNKQWFHDANVRARR